MVVYKKSPHYEAIMQFHLLTLAESKEYQVGC